jgi:hypothetical protein
VVVESKDDVLNVLPGDEDEEDELEEPEFVNEEDPEDCRRVEVVDRGMEEDEDEGRGDGVF